MTTSERERLVEQPMPYDIGPLPDPGVFVRDTAITVHYRTTPEALTTLLPACFSPVEPIIQFKYRHIEGLDWLDGGMVRAMQVGVLVQHDGPDAARGMFWPAVWETEFYGVLIGREVMGMPKRLGEIQASLDVGGHSRCTLSDHGRPLLEIRFEHGPELTGAELDTVRTLAAGVPNVLGYRHVPTVDLRGVELSQATCYPISSTIHRAWRGHGDVRVFETEPELHRYCHHTVNAFAAIPLLENVGSLLVEGSGVIALGEGCVLSDSHV